jgi:SAM-dependent methyltransferase
MPESLLARIIRVSSNEGDCVLDPFCGSGTTAVVAHKLNRAYASIDLSQTYAEAARERISEAEGLPVESEDQPYWPPHAELELRWLFGENKLPLRQLRADAALLSLFTAKLNQRLQKQQPFTPEEVYLRLDQLDRTGRLNPLDKMSTPPVGASLLEE